MAETSNLKLFLPGTDDNVGVESSLSTNFQNIDDNLGNGLKDRTGKTYTSLGERLNIEQEKYDQAKTDVDTLKKRSANVRMNDPMFRTIAHRGGVSAPENTLPAFMMAIEQGFYGIEFDIQLTSDNKWVVIHDATVDRTSSGTGNINAMTLAQARALDFGSKHSAYYAGTRIPTFDEVLALCVRGNIVPYIEFKINPTDAQTQEVVNLIKKYGLENVAVIICATMATLQKVRYYTDNIALAYVTSSITQAGIDSTVALGNAFISAKIDTVTQANVDLVKAAGLPLESWTINTNRDLLKVSAMGLRGITTDRLANQRGF